ncbi:putative polysaccharide biosynthesis protein [Bacillus tuaregi]|uniref:putative polysaccharide biosynthesis protein n=1 Tax=Bacillus tuaregi TaxID=1816695 RepID=UPI0008F9755E|nr:polysaccharide biosynthesis protein [Bacillus tuaregi]
MQPKDQGKYLFRGTLILTVGALFTKILSAFYRIPFQNIVGDVGFYIYQQVYPFYGIAVVLSTYGFPVVISKLYAEEIMKKEQGNLRQLFFVSLSFLCGFGFLCFVILFSGANWLANYMKDPQLARLLQLNAVVFLIMPAISLFRGFFQGSGYMLPTAVSQVGEQLIRVMTILVSAVYLVHFQYSLYTVGSGAVIGSITGGLTAALILILFWLRIRNREGLHKSGIFQQSGRIIKAFILYALPICISSMLLILLQLADSLNLYSLLVEAGTGSQQAKELKGVYDRGQPLIQLGTVVATSMSLSLVPLITKERLLNNAQVLKEKIELALKSSILIGVGATMGLWGIIKPTNRMLFENSEGSDVLAVLGTLILLGSIIMTITAILQGLGHTIFPAVTILVGFLCKYILNHMLVPQLGTMGAAIASVASLSVILIVFIIKLHTIMGEFIINKRFYMVMIAAGFSMLIVLNLYLYLTDFTYQLNPSDRLTASIQALSAVVLGGFLYLLIILRSNIFKVNELSLLPFGSKLTLFLPKRRRRE